AIAVRNLPVQALYLKKRPVAATDVAPLGRYDATPAPVLPRLTGSVPKHRPAIPVARPRSPDDQSDAATVTIIAARSLRPEPARGACRVASVDPAPMSEQP